MILYNLKLNLQSERTLYTDMVFTTGDVKAYRLQFFFESCGAPFDVTGCGLVVKAKRPDGTVVIDSGLVTEEGAVYYDVKSSLYAVPGTLSLEVALAMPEGGYATAKELLAEVREGFGEGDLTAGDTTPILAKLMEQSLLAQATAKTAQATAEAAAEAAASNSESIAKLAETVADEAANAVKGRAEGKNIQLSGVSPVAHKVKAAVKEGKNLLGYRSFTKTGLGLTVSYDADTQIFTINGTTTGTGTINLTEYMVEKPDIGVGNHTMLSVYYVSGTVSKVSTGNGIHLGQNDVNTTTDGSSNYSSVVFVDPADADGVASTSHATAIAKRYVSKTWIYVYDTAVTYTDYRFKLQLKRELGVADFVPYYNRKETSMYACGRNILGFKQFSPITARGITLEYDADTQIFTLNGTATTSGTNLIITSAVFEKIPYIGTGTTATLSAEYVSGSLTAEDNYNVFHLGVSDTASGASSNWIDAKFPASGKTTKKAALTKDYVVAAWVYIGNTAVTYTDYKFRIQLELGNATELEEFKVVEGVNNDGVVSIESISPDMTILADVPEVGLDVSYNRDTNKVIEELTNAIIALGGSVPAAAAAEGEG